MADGIVPGTRTMRIDQLRAQAASLRKAGQEALAALPDVQDEIAKVEREEEAVYEGMTRP